MGEKYAVIGGLGLVGRALVQALDQQGVETLAVSRRSPDFATQATFVQLDLTDRDACAAAFAESRWQQVTHLVYCALFEQPDLLAGWRDDAQIRTNVTMLENVLDHLTPDRHLTLLQGTKAYGAHLRPMSLPGKEWQERPPGDNFYWPQEDLVRARQANADWAFSIMRPQIVCGLAAGSPMNMVAAIGALAALERAAGKPFCYPGTDGFVTEATDADLLAQAILWAGQAASARDETYNVTNGDVIHWPSLWSELAQQLGVEAGEPNHRILAPQLEAYEKDWEKLRQAHGLNIGLGELVDRSWTFADAVFGSLGSAQSTLLSTIKIRQHGFSGCIDSTEMFAKHFEGMRRLRWLP